MNVSLLYSDGCPNWEQTLADVREVLAEYHVKTDVELIKVSSQQQAEEMEFLGSPTVRVEGMDVEPDILESGFNLECRVYWIDDDPASRPPKEWIAAAVEVALE